MEPRVRLHTEWGGLLLSLSPPLLTPLFPTHAVSLSKINQLIFVKKEYCCCLPGDICEKVKPIHMQMILIYIEPVSDMCYNESINFSDRIVGWDGGR